MTQPAPIPIEYAYLNTINARDNSHLRTLSICHYIWGGLTMLFSCIFIVHIVIGILAITGKLAPSSNPPPPFFGYMFLVMGSMFVLLGWTLGVLTIFSGRCIAARRRRVFSLVIAGINCASFPFGTVLGVFTFIVLLRTSVQEGYGLARAA